MTASLNFAAFSPTTYADVLGRSQVMSLGIREMWPGIPRLAGPAFTVQCPPGDNLMLHAAIYRAAPGDVIVVQAGDVEYALSGGNVCAIAQQRGIAGFVADGVIRDVAEVREARFPVFARGAVPIPGKKQTLGTLNQPIVCGGVSVSPGDIIIADEEGVVAIPAAQQQTVWEQALHKSERESLQTLTDWEANHHAKIDGILKDLGFQE